MGWWGPVSRAGVWWRKRHTYCVCRLSVRTSVPDPCLTPSYGGPAVSMCPTSPGFFTLAAYSFFPSAKLTAISPLLSIPAHPPQMCWQSSFTAVASPVLFDLWVYIFLILSLSFYPGFGWEKRYMCVVYLPYLTQIPFCLPEFRKSHLVGFSHRGHHVL